MQTKKQNIQKVEKRTENIIISPEAMLNRKATSESVGR